ncbi:MAG: hypothetical protein WA188_05875 [Terriglobales bacterium]
MNIDDRLDRLVERHEALAESVQLLTRDVHSLAESVQTHERYLSEIKECTARLLHVAQSSGEKH